MPFCAHSCSRTCTHTAGKLLAKEASLKADFSRAKGAVSEAKLTKQARFLPNPEPNWGPKARHKKVKETPSKGTEAAADGAAGEGVDVATNET